METPGHLKRGTRVCWHYSVPWDGNERVEEGVIWRRNEDRTKAQVRCEGIDAQGDNMSYLVWVPVDDLSVVLDAPATTLVATGK